jgi:glycosyltransferase involved in cell wall biosynthesis
MHKLTVVMPVYNGEKFLEETIESILCQTFRDFKYMILNDNSTDSTLNILEKYKAKDDRIIIINKDKNEGPAKLRNEGIALAKTNYVALMDADDIAMPTRFEKQIKILEENENIGLCGTWFTIFGNKKEKLIKHAIFHDELKVQFLNCCGIGNPTTMFKKDKLGNLKFENQFVPAEDYGLWSQFINVTEFYNIPESLLKYRWHPNNISQTKEENLRKSELLIKKRQLENFGILLNQTDFQYYVNAVSLKRNLTPFTLKKTIEASNILLQNNLKLKYCNPQTLEKHINKVIIRSIRNVKNMNLSYFFYLKNESEYFSKIPIIDKMLLFIKCLFSIKQTF